MNYLHIHDIPFFILIFCLFIPTKPQPKLIRYPCDIYFHLNCIINLLNWNLISNKNLQQKGNDKLYG